MIVSDMPEMGSSSDVEPKTGYIALLDVLGFSELLARETRDEELSKYFKAVDEATDEDTAPIEYVLFSDSIVISTPANSEDSLLALLRACSSALYYLLKAGLPIRGAISHGSYLRSQTSKGILIAGHAFAEAYRFERAQNWVGVLVAPSVLRSFPRLESLCRLPLNHPITGEVRADFENRLGWAMTVQRHCSIPWHTDDPRRDTFDAFAVVPTDPSWSVPDMAEGLTLMAQWLEEQRLLAGEPNAQFKYEKTSGWISDLGRYWEPIGQKW